MHPENSIRGVGWHGWRAIEAVGGHSNERSARSGPFGRCNPSEWCYGGARGARYRTDEHCADRLPHAARVYR